MRPDQTVAFHRVPLAHALRTLPPTEFRLLTLLGLEACPRTKRIWTTPLRLAEELDGSRRAGDPALPPGVVDAVLTVLLARGHITLYARGHGALRCYEVGLVVARYADEPPSNLPVEHVP